MITKRQLEVISSLTPEELDYLLARSRKTFSYYLPPMYDKFLSYKLVRKDVVDCGDGYVRMVQLTQFGKRVVEAHRSINEVLDISDIK